MGNRVGRGATSKTVLSFNSISSIFMTYPLGCFPSAFLGFEMEEQKAALEKGIYSLIVGWSRMEPVLGLDDSYGSFAIWDSL